MTTTAAPKARTKSIVNEAKQIARSVELINLGARMQVLESETDLSYERLIRLYKEVSGKSPSKGQLPFSTDWFITWQENIHASLFLNIHEYLNKAAALDEIDTIIKAYNLYVEQTKTLDLEAMLSVTRAWRLVKFIDNGMLTMTKCSTCGGQFVTHPHEIAKHYVCGLCNVPGRAGHGSASGKIKLESQNPRARKSPAGGLETPTLAATSQGAKGAKPSAAPDFAGPWSSLDKRSVAVKRY